MTTFFLPSSTTTPVTPGYAAWTRTSEADRREMHTVKRNTAHASKTMWANTNPAADATCLQRQYVSKPMAAGIAFAVADTIRLVARVMESSANDNINREPIRITVYSRDGTTLRATLLALGNIGTVAEWNTSLRSQRHTGAVSSTLGAAYTTVDGDRLVLEIGGQVSAAGGTGVTGTHDFGDLNADVALDYTDVDVGVDYPWFEISRTITFEGANTGRDIATRFLLGILNHKDIVTRFRLWIQGYKDILTRFKLTVQGYKDIATRFLLALQGFKDITTRFQLTIQGYLDITTRFLLWATSYKDITTRFLLTAQSYKDITTRFLLATTAYKDIFTRFQVVIEGYKDIVTRFYLSAGTLAYKDIETRFLLTVQAYKDITTRFYLTVQGYLDITTRFQLTVQAYKDITTHFLLWATSYIDIQTRFQLVVSGYKDITTRFRLLAQGYKDIATRFALSTPSFVDIHTRFYLATLGANYPVIGGGHIVNVIGD